MVDRPADSSVPLIPPQVVVEPIPDPVLELAPESEPGVVTQPEPSLLNDRERKRMDLAMQGLSRFAPVAELSRPEPRTEVDSLSSVSAADWSGLDGMGDADPEEIAPPSRPEPVFASQRREAAPAPVSVREPAFEANPAPIPATDPIKGWVTADTLFSDFGD